MEVGGEVDSKKKLDQRMKELVKQLRNIDEFTDVPRIVADEQKEKWRQELQDIGTERKYMKRYKGTFDIFLGIGHRMRKEELEDQFKKETKQGWRLADASRIGDENASSEDCNHTSRGVFVAIVSNLGGSCWQRRRST